MLGYDKLKSSKRTEIIGDIKREFTNSTLEKISKRSSNLIFGKAIADAELITRQFLLQKMAYLELNKLLLSSFANVDNKIELALPKEWRLICQSHGVQLSRIRSSIAWRLLIFQSFCKSFSLIIPQLLSSLARLFGFRPIAVTNNPGAHIYFSNLTSKNLPQTEQGGKSYDVITWYMQWQGLKTNFDSIHHDVANSNYGVIEDIPYAYSPIASFTLTGRKSHFEFIKWCLRVILLLLMDWIIGRWWHILMLPEAVQACRIRLCEKETLAKEYFFHNSSWIYRPLWTYDAEQKGSKITLYFYSTNIELFATNKEVYKFHYGYQSMNWPHYIVWDSYQGELIKKAIQPRSAEVSVAGPIWFTTTSGKIPKLPKKTFSVFDVQPYRDTHYKLVGIEYEYYIPEVCNQFLTDILEVVQLNEGTMVLKRKRDVGSLIHTQYRKHLDSLQMDSTFFEVDPDISAYKLIEVSEVVISMPWTSTALIAKELDKPCCYYDPTSKLDKLDQAAHGIEVVQGKRELDRWIKITSARNKEDKLQNI